VARRGPAARDRTQRAPGRARRAAAGRRGGGRAAAPGACRQLTAGLHFSALMRYTAHMAESHSLEEIINRPGVYFNPQTEVLIVVDDSAELDGEIFNMEQFEGAEWVVISDETPLDEHRRDELLE